MKVTKARGEGVLKGRKDREEEGRREDLETRRAWEGRRLGGEALEGKGSLGGGGSLEEMRAREEGARGWLGRREQVPQ